MKRLLCIAALALTAGPALAQVSIGVNVPGVYGRMNLAGFPHPDVGTRNPLLYTHLTLPTTPRG